MTIESLTDKLLGAVTGALVAVIFIPPKTRTEFARRITAPVAVGVIAAPALLYYSGWPLTSEFVQLSAGISAFLSWRALPLAFRWLRAWGDRRADPDGGAKD